MAVSPEVSFEVSLHQLKLSDSTHTPGQSLAGKGIDCQKGHDKMRYCWLEFLILLLHTFMMKR